MPTVDLEPDRVLRSRPVHWLWRVGGGCFVVLVLGFSAVQAASELAHEEYTEVTDFPFAGVDVIEIHNAPGSVRVVAADDAGADTITVTATVSDGFRPTQHHERLEGNRLLIEASCPVFLGTWCSVGYTVVTPPDVDVVVRSEESVTVTDTTGMVDVDTADGRVEVARLSGTVKLDTTDGRIDATDLGSDDVDVRTIDGGVYVDFDRSPRAVRAKTIDGGVEIVIPDDEGIVYRVETDTVDGNITTAVRSDPSAERSIVAETIDGSVTVRYG